MSNAALIALVVTLLLAGGAVLLVRRKPADPAGVASAAPRPEIAPAAEDSPSQAHATRMLGEARDLCYRTAFSVVELHDTLPESHRQVVAEARQSLQGIADRERALPRRPMLLPQLLRALNDVESTRDDLAAIILQDPVLAADVLRFANSPYYRVSPDPVDSLDRAIVLLGFDGLKSVVAASILQPVFRTPKGRFEAFAPTLWELAMRTATAAGIYAARTGIADRFTAQLLGLLSVLGPLAVFRVLDEAYQKHPDRVPRAEAFVSLIEDQGDATSSTIAAHWQLPAAFVEALAQSRGTGRLEGLAPLARALEAGRCCALLSLAPAGSQRTILANKAAMAMGLETTAFDAVWSALNKAIESR